MQSAEDLLSALFPRSEFTLIEWVRRGWIAEVNRLTPYFISYLYCPFDLKPVGTAEYLIEKEQCKRLYRKILEDSENGPLHGSRRCFTEGYWPFKLPDCPELSRMSHAARKRYEKERLYPFDEKEVLTCLISRDDFKEWMQELDIHISAIRRETFLSLWLNLGEDTEHGNSLNKDSPSTKGKRERQIDAFVKICNEHDIPKDESGLFVASPVKNIMNICQGHPIYKGLFLSGWDEFWYSKERYSVAFNPNAARHKAR